MACLSHREFNATVEISQKAYKILLIKNITELHKEGDKIK